MTTTTTFLTPNLETFDQEVLAKSGHVLVDFWASWCGPCLGFKPVVEAVASERDGLEAAFINVDENPELAERFEIRSIPSLRLFKDGELVGELTGYRSKADLEAWLDTQGA